MVGQHSTLSAGGVQGRTRRQPPGATNEERGRARFPFTIMQSCSRPASDRCRGGQPLEATNEVRGRARFPSTTTQSRSRPASDNYRGGLPLEATNEVRGRARFPSTTIQSRSRPASDDCRGARWGPWVNSTCALLHSTLISRGARGRTRTRCQPPVATNEVRGRAQFPSTSLQSCSRPARQGRRGD